MVRVGTVSIIKPRRLVCTRLSYSEAAFAELVLWQISKPVARSGHSFKYRLTYVVHGECVLRYDNEAGRGDLRHFGAKEDLCKFTAPDQLIADFQRDIARWNNEHLDS